MELAFPRGLVLFFCGSAYVAYLMRSGLGQRNSLKKTRVLTMRAPAKMKWGAVNVALHWFVYALVVFLTVTGVILYLGYGNWWVYLHSVAAFIGLAYISPISCRIIYMAAGGSFSEFFAPPV